MGYGLAAIALSLIAINLTMMVIVGWLRRITLHLERQKPPYWPGKP